MEDDLVKFYVLRDMMNEAITQKVFDEHEQRLVENFLNTLNQFTRIIANIRSDSSYTKIF